MLQWLVRRGGGWKAHQQELATACTGILQGKIRADFVEHGVVDIQLTDAERGEYLAAILSARSSWFGHAVAHYLSPQLESVLCGHTPERYHRVMDH